MAMPKFRIKSPAFRIPQGTSPIFLNRDQLLFLGSRGGVIYDLSTRKKTTSVKVCSDATELAVSESGDWVATKNMNGEIVVARLSDGSPVHKYKRPPYQDSGQLAPCRDDKHFVDSTDGVVHLHSVEQGKIIRSFNYGDDGWMSAGVVFAESSGQIIVGVTPKFSNPVHEKGVSFLHFLRLEGPSEPSKTVEITGDLERFSLSADESQLALVLKGEELGKLEVRRIDLAGEQIATHGIEAKSVYFSSPTWTTDGTHVVLITDLSKLLFLDADTLHVEHEYQGPKLTGLAFQPDSELVALTGESSFGGLVIPESQIEEWSALEGEPRSRRLADEFYAYSLHIKLRKACPPRAALFVCGEELFFESERLVGYFRYLPGRVESTAKLSDSPALIGAGGRKALEAFEDNPDAREAVLGPTFPGESDRLISAGVPENRVTYVRYLGHEIPYEVDHSDIDTMLMITPFEGRMHLMLCRSSEDGRFFESHWPHAHLDETASDAELGIAILRALEDFPKNLKYVY